MPRTHYATPSSDNRLEGLLAVKNKAKLQQQFQFSLFSGMSQMIYMGSNKIKKSP
jgi:hypothetical protein